MDIDGDVHFDRWLANAPSRFVAGDLRADVLVLREGDAPLVVEGDLVVERDVVIDAGAGALVVMGELRAAHVFNAELLFVRRVVHARVVYANGDGRTVVYGGLEAGLLLATDDHVVSVLDALRATIVDVSGSGVEGKTRKKLSRSALAADLEPSNAAQVRAWIEERRSLLA
jgi:hypothetical protein